MKMINGLNEISVGRGRHISGQDSGLSDFKRPGQGSGYHCPSNSGLNLDGFLIHVEAILLFSSVKRTNQ